MSLERILIIYIAAVATVLLLFGPIDIDVSGDDDNRDRGMDAVATST